MIDRANLPELAISVRQPWAWAIVQGHKPLENRSRGAIKFMVPLTGQRAIHASKGMTREEYEEGRDFILSRGIMCPAPADLLRGGIIGAVEVVREIAKSDSPWFFGPRALVLQNPQPCEFIPSVGALGYFKWKPADSSIVPKPARWMLPQPEASPPKPKHGERLPDLFEKVA